MTKKIQDSNVKSDMIEQKKEKSIQNPFYYAVGRRKEATARVKLFVSSSEEIKINDKVLKRGNIYVNLRPIEEYFPGEVSKKLTLEPFRTTNTIGRFTVSGIVTGGGTAGQLQAFIHGISRALEKVDKEKYRLLLKKKRLLTRDPRVKERRKAGLAQKARAKKQSPKR